MITEDQLEQLAIQWFQDTGVENIDPSPPVGYAGTRHRTPNMERRSEEKRRLAEAVRRLNPKQEPSSRPSPMRRRRKIVVEEVVA